MSVLDFKMCLFVTYEKYWDVRQNLKFKTQFMDWYYKVGVKSRAFWGYNDKHD